MAFIFGQNDIVKIDHAHSQFIKSLVMCSKPKTILEIGLGGGESADAIIDGIIFNELATNYTIVDNWLDFDYQMPNIVQEKYSKYANLITSGEYEFVHQCTDSFDLIMSDADHSHSQIWFDHVFNNLLNPGGYLIYHDVTNAAYPNLFKIVESATRKNLNFFIFNKNSLPSERCDRGLIVIKK